MNDSQSRPVANTLDPSPEQSAPIEFWRDAPRHSAIVSAGPGTGKTTLLKMIGQRRRQPGLYTVFNRGIRERSALDMPKHVACYNIHQLAFWACRIHELNNRLTTGRLIGADVAHRYHIPQLDKYKPTAWGNWVIQTVDNFCNSADRDIGETHLPKLPLFAKQGPLVVEWAKTLWRDINDEDASESGERALPLQHNHYLKAWHLNGAKTPHNYEYIMVDEAQDLWPIFAAIIKMQGKPTLYVGDEHQKIYGYLGAISAFDGYRLPIFPLRQSFRFGPQIAEICNLILRHHTKPPALPLRGNPNLASALVERRPADIRQTVIARTNAGLLEDMIATPGTLYVADGLSNIIRQLLDAHGLKMGRQVIDNGSLCRFRNFEELNSHATETNDQELRVLVKIVKKLGPELPKHVADLRAREVRDPALATNRYSTLHRFKELEDDHIRLADDFPDFATLFAKKRDNTPYFTDADRDTEADIIYTAASRARRTLQGNAALHDYLTQSPRLRPGTTDQTLRKSA